MKALTLVTLSTTLAVFALGGFLYVVRQEAEIDRLRALERDQSAWISETERVNEEIDALARESRLFASRLAEARESFRGRGVSRRASAERDFGAESTELLAVLSALRAEIELLRRRTDDDGDGRELRGSLAPAVPSSSRVRPREGDAPPSRDSSGTNTALAASEADIAEDGFVSNAAGETSGVLPPLVEALEMRVASLEASLASLSTEIAKDARTQKESVESAAESRVELGRKIEELRAELAGERAMMRESIERDSTAFREELASFGDRVKAAVVEAMAPARAEIDALRERVALGDDRVAELSRSIAELSASSLAAVEEDREASAEAGREDPPAADSGAITPESAPSETMREAPAREKSGEAGPAPAERAVAEGSFDPLSVKVELVDSESKLVAFDGGASAGLREGEELAVLRGGRPIATVQLIHVEDDLAAAKVIKVVPGETIREGDPLGRKARAAGPPELNSPAQGTASAVDVPPPPP